MGGAASYCWGAILNPLLAIVLGAVDDSMTWSAWDFATMGLILGPSIIGGIHIVIAAKRSTTSAYEQDESPRSRRSTYDE
jgi:hypothetical protein